MKMQFMSVFCVILNLNFGVSLPDRSNGMESPSNNQINYRSFLDSRYNLSEIGQNWEQKKAIEDSSQLYKSTSSLPGNIITKLRGSFAKYINRQQFQTRPLDHILPSTLVTNSKPGVDKNESHKLIADRTHQPSEGSNKLHILNQMMSRRQDENYNLVNNKRIPLSRPTITKLSEVTSFNRKENVRKRNWSGDKLQQLSILHPTLTTESPPSGYQNQNILYSKNNEFENLNGQPRKIFGRNINDEKRIEEEIKQTTLQQRQLSLPYLETLPNTYHYVNNLNRAKEELKFIQNQPPTVAGGSTERSAMTKLELQELSPDNIASLLSTSSPENPYKLEVQSVPIVDKYAKTAQSGIAAYQNPTAEILYTMQQAQPYRISPEHILHKPSDSYNAQNNLNVNKLLDLHETIHPDKRYILVHPDGKIEHVDNIEMVATQFPHYISVKSSDLKKYSSGHTNYLPTSLVHLLVKRKPTFTNVIQSPSVSIEQKKNNEAFIESAINTKSNINDGSLVPVSEKISGKQAVAEMKQNISSQDQKTTVPIVIGKDFRFSNIQDLNVDVNLTVEHINRFDAVESLNGTVVNTPALRNNSYIKKGFTEEVSIDKSYNQMQNASDKREDMGFVNSEIMSSNFQDNRSLPDDSLTRNETQGPNVLNEDHTENCNKSSNLATNGGENFPETLLTNTPLPSSEIVNKSGFWFQADENFWESLINDTENLFYFLFVSPIPIVERETTRTIYPNGTIVEEVIEKINDDTEPINSRKMITTNSTDTSN